MHLVDQMYTEDQRHLYEQLYLVELINGWILMNCIYRLTGEQMHPDELMHLDQQWNPNEYELKNCFQFMFFRNFSLV